MSKRIFIAIIAILLFSFDQSFAQNVIRLNNPSFEDFPRPASPPRGWFDCGRINFPNETPPDVHPESPVSVFKVNKVAQEGDTYLGLVVRENDSWESVAQRLNAPMYPDQCYTFSIHLARSATYESALRGSAVKVNFTQPLKLRVWGGTGYCEKKELLGESEIVRNTDWKQFDFKFEPKQRTTYIILEAFFKTPTLSPPNGNLLLDNASAIQPIPCDEEIPVVKKPEVEITNPPTARETVAKNTFNLLAKVMNIERSNKIIVKVNGKNSRDFSFNPTTNNLKVNIELREGINEISIRAANSAGNARDQATLIYEPPVETPIVKTDPKPTKTEMEKILDKLDEGETIKVDKLFFDINSFEINDVSKPALDEIFTFMNNNSLVKVEIGGHTNRNCQTDYCNELSANRAKAVVDYLINKGIDKNRLAFKGYGKTKPVTFSPSKEMQKKNQRVEIKITSKKG